jgi:uncharacterized protein YoxC
MDIWTGLAHIFASISLGALCIYAIITLRDVRRGMKAFSQTMEQLPQELKEIRGRTLGMLKNFEDISKNAALVMQKLQTDMNSSEGIFAEIDALTKQLRRLREHLQNGIIQPIAQISATISALSKGTSVFMETMKRGNDTPSVPPHQRRDV